MSQPHHPDDGLPDDESELATLTRPKVERPRLWRVLLHNDDYTTMDFVVLVLEKIFRKDSEEAAAIMLAVHRKGVGVAGVYTREIAETKVAKTTDLARANEFPLLVTMEPDE